LAELELFEILVVKYVDSDKYHFGHVMRPSGPKTAELEPYEISVVKSFLLQFHLKVLLYKCFRQVSSPFRSILAESEAFQTLELQKRVARKESLHNLKVHIDKHFKNIYIYNVSVYNHSDPFVYNFSDHFKNFSDLKSFKISYKKWGNDILSMFSVNPSNIG
jgi:hypothetical protein